jgi:hypothetical protein
MSDRIARNIDYKSFLTSVSDEYDDIACNKLVIPEFQRNYVWTNSNIKDIFNSIKENGNNYYLGNIVIVKDGNNRSKIVDGQQRLVTLSLISKALTSVENANSNDLINLIWADPSHRTSRILFQKENLQSIYEAIINDKEIPEQSLDKSQLILFKSYNSIKRLISELENVEAFTSSLLTLEFVVIKSESDEDAYQLFEGLNSNGLSLSAVELTKNAILGKIKNLDESKINTAIEVWNSLEKNFETTNIGWFNKFLRYQMFSDGGYIGNAELFKTIKKEVVNKSDASAVDLIDYIVELKSCSEIYISFRTSNINKGDFNLSIAGESWQRIQNFIYFMKCLEIEQVYSVLLSLYKYGKDEPRYHARGVTFSEHLEKLWNFLLIVKYTKISPSYFERDFAAICKDIKHLSYNKFKEKMDTFFKLLGAKISNLKDDFTYDFSNSIDYQKDDRNMIRYILDEYLLSVGQGSDSNIETEHIVPENNQDEWISIEDKNIVRMYVGRIGNLTLLKDTLNNDAGSKNFDCKYQEAYRYSRYTSNTQLKCDWGDKFNSSDPVEQAIIPRGMIIAGIIYEKYKNNLLI